MVRATRWLPDLGGAPANGSRFKIVLLQNRPKLGFSTSLHARTEVCIPAATAGRKAQRIIVETTTAKPAAYLHKERHRRRSKQQSSQGTTRHSLGPVNYPGVGEVLQRRNLHSGRQRTRATGCLRWQRPVRLDGKSGRMASRSQLSHPSN